jgi:hypothetical protein
LIDLAQGNSVQWPEPRRGAASELAARRHYVRVSAEPHAGLARRVESLVRRAGLSVQARATRSEARAASDRRLAASARPADPHGEGPPELGTRLHHFAFVVSPSTDARMTELVDQIARLGRVERRSWLGIVE